MRVDAKTMLCHAHNVHGCPACMVSDFFEEMQKLFEARKRAAAEAKATTVVERFDLGGEA